MFQFDYFILFTAIGFGVGFSHKSESDEKATAFDGLNPILNIVAFIGCVWSLFTFGLLWGFVTLGELFLGYYFGQMARRS